MNKVYFLLVLSLALISCRKNKASWDSDYTIPLINDSLTLENYVNDSTLAVDNAGYYELKLKRELLNFNLNSEVSIPDTLIVNSFSSQITVNVPPGVSFINDAQENDFSLDNLELSEVILSKGQILVKVFNPYPTDVICEVILPNTTKDGVVVTDELVVSPGTIANPTIGEKTIDVSFSKMDLTGLLGTGFNKLSYQINIKSDPNGIAVSSSPSHVTNVETKLQNLEIFYAKGYFGNRIITDTVETDIEILQTWIDGDLDLQDVNLNLALTNSIKAMGRITLKELQTTHHDGTVTSLNSNQINVPQNVNPATGEWQTLSGSVLNFPFNATNSNIETFLEKAGAKIKVIYEFELNPLGNITSSSNEIFPNSEARLDLSLDMPLAIGMTDLTLRDTIDLDLTKNADQIERAQFAEITAEVENGFPIQGKLSLNVLNELDEIILTVSSAEVVQSSVFGFPNSQGVNTVKSNLKWSLSKEELAKLKSGKKLVITSVFDTPDASGSTNTSIQFQEKSFLNAKILLHLTYQNQI